MTGKAKWIREKDPVTLTVLKNVKYMLAFTAILNCALQMQCCKILAVRVSSNVFWILIFTLSYYFLEYEKHVGYALSYCDEEGDEQDEQEGTETDEQSAVECAE